MVSRRDFFSAIRFNFVSAGFFFIEEKNKKSLWNQLIFQSRPKKFPEKK